MIRSARIVLQSAMLAMALSAAVSTSSYAQSAATPAAVAQAYQELFALSQKEKRGLMFFVKGQQIGGAVVRVIGNDAVEVRNQTYSRIIIRLDSIDAVSMN